FPWTRALVMSGSPLCKVIVEAIPLNRNDPLLSRRVTAATTRSSVTTSRLLLLTAAYLRWTSHDKATHKSNLRTPILRHQPLQRNSLGLIIHKRNDPLCLLSRNLRV